MMDSKDMNSTSTSLPLMPVSSLCPTVSLSLKCPSYPDKAFSLDVPHNATIQNIKLAIQNEYFCHPPIDTIKLIFAGKILGDDLVLSNILERSGLDPLKATPTFHLVLKAHPKLIPQPTSTVTHSMPTASSSPLPELASSSSPLANGPLSSASFASGQLLDTQRLMSPMYGVFPYQVVVINGIPYAVAPSPLLSPPLSASLSSPLLSSFTPLNLQQNTPPPPPPPVEQQRPPEPQPQPAPVVAAGMGALAANVDEFDDAARNAPPNPWWLLFKLSFLVYIFSQNASTTRVFLLYATALVIFLVQTRWLTFPIRRRPENQPAERPAPDNSSPAGQGEAIENAPQQTSFLQNLHALVWTFISTLIPENNA